MQCPRCASLGVPDSETTMQVAGTQYCTPHGIEEWQLAQDPRRNRGLRTPSTPPPMPLPVPPPVSPPES